MESPRETIIGVAAENRVLRWGIIALSVAVTVAVVKIWTQRPVVWLVTDNGQIMRGYTKVVAWEPMEAARRALEAFFIPAQNRENLVKAYFKSGPLSAAMEHIPQDRFISFRASKQEEADGKISVSGALYRESQPASEMTLLLERVDRSEINPFGLAVVSTTIQPRNQ